MGAARAIIAAVSAPVPHPTSRTMSPGAIASDWKMRASTIGGPAMIPGGTLNFAALKPDAGNPQVRFDEREVETEQGLDSEAPPDERGGNR